MKKTILLSFMLTVVFGLTGMAQSKTENIKVYGKCGMCQKRIETAAKSVDGVTKATWDMKTQMMEVSFDSTKTNLDKIELAEAKVGHDTDMHKADNETYNNLPSCCHYDRPDGTKSEMKKDCEMKK